MAGIRKSLKAPSREEQNNAGINLKKLALISAICFLVLVQSVHATGTEMPWEGEVMLYCEEACVEGFSCKWVASVKNIDTASFTFREMKIINEDNKTLSFARLNFTLKPKWTGNIGVEGLIPEPTDGIVYYKLCLKLEQGDKTEYACQDSLISTPITGAEETEFMEDSDCSELESCVDYKCKVITCEGCSYVSNGVCVPFECCANEDCMVGQGCVDHECVDTIGNLIVPENYTQEKIQKHTIMPSMIFVVSILILIVMTSLIWGIIRQYREREL